MNLADPQVPDDFAVRCGKGGLPELRRTEPPARQAGGARLNGRNIAVSGCVRLSDALVALSFPPHTTANSVAVTDFLAIVPHVHSVRRTGSTAINLAWLACGRLDAFWVRRIASWDVAAGLLILREAGGSLGGFAGGPASLTSVSLDQPAFIAACTPAIVAELRSRLCEPGMAERERSRGS